MFACQTRLRRMRTALLLLACSLLVAVQHTHARTLGKSRQIWQHASVPSSDNVERTSLSAESETQLGHDRLHSILSHEVASPFLDVSIETTQLESPPRSQMFAIQAEPASMLDIAQEPLWRSADQTQTPTGGPFEAATGGIDEEWKPSKPTRTPRDEGEDDAPWRPSRPTRTPSSKDDDEAPWRPSAPTRTPTSSDPGSSDDVWSLSDLTRTPDTTGSEEAWRPAKPTRTPRTHPWRHRENERWRPSRPKRTPHDNPEVLPSTSPSLRPTPAETMPTPAPTSMGSVPTPGSTSSSPAATPATSISATASDGTTTTSSTKETTSSSMTGEATGGATTTDRGASTTSPSTLTGSLTATTTKSSNSSSDNSLSDSAIAAIAGCGALGIVAVAAAVVVYLRRVAARKREEATFTTISFRDESAIGGEGHVDVPYSAM